MSHIDLDFWQLQSRRDRALSESTKVLLAEMAYHFRFGVDRMPQKHFATLLNWSEGTVKRAVRQAVAGRWLTSERVEHGESNRYRHCRAPTATTRRASCRDDRAGTQPHSGRTECPKTS
jgi:hypothetical protein